MARIMRAKMPPQHVDVRVDPAPKRGGVILQIGDTRLHLRPAKALLVADAIVDQIEEQERARKLVRE